ncbi:A-kinase anchor protein 12 isoform X1 [Alligator sinensis]|uniref:A-kinase anchor protein 12 isoform X1 n=2 Tax=Alligator sinensis TaxID=38654 RepID=A0A1U7RK84_ALLSI|nr:A-kinase anchor protein 12 isoform X1 [Alligator sinensis]
MLGTITITVGQREPTNVILKEEIAENMETTQSEATDKDDKDGVKEDQMDAQDATEQLPSPDEKVEEMEQSSEPQSNDVGFKKVFKFVGFKFTVKKDKTEKSEPVQLLTVKKEDLVSADGAGDHKEVQLEEVEEATQSEVTHPVEKIEETTESEERKDESPPEKLAESPSEEAEGSKVAEVKKDPSKSPESPTALVNETSSPLRKFFTQGWAGFRKKTSFRKPKDDEQQSPENEKNEQEKDGAEIAVEPIEKEKIEEEKQEQDNEVVEIPTETSEREKTEKEKQDQGKDVTDVPLQASEKEKTDKEEQEQTVAEIPTEVSEKEKRSKKDVQEQERDVAETPEETTLKEVTVLSEQPVLQETTVSVNKESEGSFEEKIEQVKEYKIALEEKTELYSEEKSELEAPLSTEVFAEKSEGKMQEKSEPVAPLAMEVFDEKVETMVEACVSTVEEKVIKAHEAELALDLSAAEQRPSSVPEQSFEGDTDLKKVQPTDEVLKDKETVCKIENDLIKQTEPVSEDVAVCKPPEGITNEVEMLSSQERAKVQGSPLKKLFTGTGLKKLSGKKHKGKREETKLGEPAAQIQHLSDSLESPDEPKAESSASSPEESTEIPSVEKDINAIRASENEEGIILDTERKRENVTPWASFKKMVTPKKRIRRPSESDKEEEIDKGKTATLSSTKSENQEEAKENSEDLKLEKNTEDPKRKVDTSVSWEAFICVGSSKKRARKSSSSDEEVGQKPAQEGQKIDESGENKDTAADTMLTSSQESDHGHGGSSAEETGSPSEGEGFSTWESFKRLVTPRRKSKTKMEDKNEEPVTAASIEHSTSDGEPGKEESWVSFRKLMPGRRKKKSDGKLEQARVDEVGEILAETAEEDSDVPAVVPLSEYEAAEREKIEAQMAVQAEAAQEGTLEEEKAEKLQDALETDQSNEGLVHAVTVTVVEGERAVTSIEERSPSWISAAVTETIEQVKEEEKPAEQISEAEVIVEETVVVTKTLPEMRKDTSDDTLMSELELTSEAVTAREEATEVSCAEEATEVSLAEETTEMVSAVSQLPETPDTTEEVTPVQEVDGTEQNLEELNKHTREILEEVAERVKLSDEAQVISEETVIEVVTQTAQEIGLEIEDEAKEITLISQETVLVEWSVKEQEFGGGDIQPEREATIQEKNEMEENALEEVAEISETCAVMREHTGETTSLDILTDESQRQAPDHATVERHEEMSEEVRTPETSDSREREFYSSVTITPKAELEVEAEYVTAVKQHIAKEEEKLNLTDLPTGETADEGDPKVDEAKVELSEELKQVVDIKTSLEPECSQVPVSAVPMLSDITAAAVQCGREDATPTLESKGREETVAEALVQGEVIEAPMKKEEEDSLFTVESKSTGVITTQLHMQSEVTEVPEQSELEDARATVETTHMVETSPEASLQREVTEVPEQSELEDTRSTVETTHLAETSPEASVQSEVTEDPLKKEVAETVLTVESEHIEAVVTDVSLQREVPAQSEVEDPFLTVETKHTKTIVTDIPTQTERAETAMQSEVEDSFPASESKYSETIATEATMQTEADNAMPPLETKCPEKIETESVLQSKVEDAVPTLESKCTEGITAGDSVQSEVPEVPVDRERHNALGSKCSEAVVTEASVQGDIFPKEVPVYGKREKEHVEAKQMLLHTTSSKDCETKKIESEQMLKMEKDFHDSGKLEIAHGDTVYSVQQEVVEPQEDMGSAIPEVESSEAQKASMPVTAASVEELVISETVMLMETTDETVQAVASVPEKLTSEIVLDKSPSLTHMECEKFDGQFVTIESQSTKIVLKIIQTAVDKLERTEKPMAVSIMSESQQQTESTDRSQEGINVSEIQKCVLADQQLAKGEETGVSKEHEIQQPSTKEKATLERTTDVPVTADTSKERGGQDSVEIAAIPEAVLSESSGYQKPIVEISVSEDFTKKSLDTDQSELKKIEVKQTVEIQCIRQQMHIEREEEHHSQSVEDVVMHVEEDVNSQDPTSHYPEMNQSQSSLALTD